MQQTSDSDERVLLSESLNTEISNLRAQLHQSQNRIKQLEEQVQNLTFLWSRAHRWKRALVLLTLAPVNWTIGFAVLASEIAARLLRKLGRRKAPLVTPADTSRCSIIVLSWEGKDLLAKSLPPLMRAVRFHGGNHEVIVLDNGSTDGTSEYVAENFPGVRVVRAEQNLFFTGGNNLGVEAAKNDIVILLNNDMFVEENFLGPLLEGFRGPSVFAVASQVFLADPNQRREETGKTRATFNGCDLDWAHDAILPSDEEREYVPVFWGHGGAVALDRQKFLWLDGLDIQFDPFYVEDADLSYRAWKVGWRCLLAVRSHVVHKHRGTNIPRYGSKFISQIVRRNQYLFIWKNFGDLPKLMNHFLRSPRRQMRRAGVQGVGIGLEVKAFLGAVSRLPAVLKRKLSLARWVVRSDEEILELISTPPAIVILESEVDFERGAYAEQLGKGWYSFEQVNGKSFRWMSRNATVFLRAPAERAELCISGCISRPRRSMRSSVVLTVKCQGKRKRFRLREGAFKQRWTVTDLTPGLPVAVDLSIRPTVISPMDGRTLGMIVHHVGLSMRAFARDAGQLEVLHPISIKNPSPPGPEVAGQRKVLMVCAYLPCLGVHSGGNTMFNLIRTLSKRHRLTILSFYERESDLEHIPSLTPHCERLEVIYRGRTLDVPNLFGLKPPEIAYDFYHKGMHHLVENYLRTHEFDLMQCEFLQTAHYANIDPSIPAVLTIHELLSLAYCNRNRNLRWVSAQKFHTLVSWMRMLNYEEKILRRFSGIVVLTRSEREYLARHVPQSPVYDHPTGVDCDFFRSRGQEPEAGTLVFVGNFRHSPNLIGIQWFLKQAWPKIRMRYPSAHLYIVGANPPAVLQEFHGLNGVTVTGWVDDVRPFLQQAAVFIAPIFDGVGLRGKVLEAWAMAKPVVGTRLAFEGLTSSNGSVCLMADDPETFAARTCELLENEDLARNMGRQARQLAVSVFSWDAFGDLYDQIYRNILEGKAHRSSVPARRPLN
jgi:polysaccharide biosynthesis protein PslH